MGIDSVMELRRRADELKHISIRHFAMAMSASDDGFAYRVMIKAQEQWREYESIIADDAVRDVEIYKLNGVTLSDNDKVMVEDLQGLFRGTDTDTDVSIDAVLSAGVRELHRRCFPDKHDGVYDV